MPLQAGATAVTQDLVEVLRDASPSGVVTQTVVESLDRVNNVSGVVTQQSVEVLRNSTATAFVTQQVVEIIYPTVQKNLIGGVGGGKNHELVPTHFAY